MQFLQRPYGPREVSPVLDSVRGRQPSRSRGQEGHPVTAGGGPDVRAIGARPAAAG